MRLFGAVALLATAAIYAQGQNVTSADISRHREQATRAKGLTDVEREEVSGLYEQAAQFLQQEIRWKAHQVGHSRTKALVETELASVRAAGLATPAPSPAPPSETAQ